jgi:hypothetical protein
VPGTTERQKLRVQLLFKVVVACPGQQLHADEHEPLRGQHGLTAGSLREPQGCRARGQHVASGPLMRLSAACMQQFLLTVATVAAQNYEEEYDKGFEQERAQRRDAAVEIVEALENLTLESVYDSVVTFAAAHVTMLVIMAILVRMMSRSCFGFWLSSGLGRALFADVPLAGCL